MDEHANWLREHASATAGAACDRFRASALRRLARTIEDRERDLLDALHADLRKPEQEA